MQKMILALALLITMEAGAQNDKYTQVMLKNIALLDSAKSIDELQSVAGNFERIGDAEKTKWLPYYYAALAQTWVGWNPQTKDKDANAAKIKGYLDKAEAIEKNAETYAVENMMYTQQMLMDPQSRWATNGKDANIALQTGLKLDPNNPRLYYLQGESLFGTPAQFGGGKDKAKPVFEKALALYKAAQPQLLAPKWGQKQVEDKLVLCQ
jgi:hypothetical protein